MSNTVLQVTPSVVIRRSFFGRCPNCGQGRLSHSWLKMAEKCDACRLSLIKGGGFTLGAMVINYGLIVFGCFPWLILAYVSDWWPKIAIWASGVFLALVAPLLIYRYAWAWWVMIYYYFLPEELPANQSRLSKNILE